MVIVWEALKSNSTGEALVAVKNNSNTDIMIVAGEVLGQVVLLPQENRPIASIQMPIAFESPDDGVDVVAMGFVEACTSGMPPDPDSRLSVNRVIDTALIDLAATKSIDKEMEDAALRTADEKRTGIS